MVWETRQLVLFIHIFLAILWVGGVLFVGWGVYPAARNIPNQIQRKIFYSLLQWTHLWFALVGAGVILTGVFLGIVMGPINGNNIWNTHYGNIWFAAFMIAVATLLWGMIVSYPIAMKTFKNVGLWENADTGEKRPLTRALLKLAAIESVEVLGFILLIMLMVSF